MRGARPILIWTILALAIAAPISAAAMSPLLAWRDPIYTAAGFAGIVAMALMLLQPLLAGGYLPGLPVQRGRVLHRVAGGMLVMALALHVGGLWITSPPDVIDALLFASPTPFSAWGVIALWAVFVAALVVLLRRPLRLRPRTWRRAHTSLVAVAAAGSVVHALLIEGTMETVSKVALSLLVIAATVTVVVDLRVWAIRPGRER